MMQAARPLLPEDRSGVLERVAAELASLPADARGVGSVARVVRQLQARPPQSPRLGRQRSIKEPSLRLVWHRRRERPARWVPRHLRRFLHFCFGLRGYCRACPCPPPRVLLRHEPDPGREVAP